MLTSKMIKNVKVGYPLKLNVSKHIMVMIDHFILIVLCEERYMHDLVLN